ncbi:histidine kinase [uncultured Kordia sp.]|uniref:sensor histidine kinase n=1 Tax=uncultured Kordia sp. TaxID=507699 RepID=UPI00262277CD|nr:histidine kinase [uncultured Kordia sp.]
MRLFNKETRIQYLGFNDIWFSTIGIVIISFIANYLFNNPSERESIELVLIGWFASLASAICDWCILRYISISLRKKYPDFKDDAKRITLLFFAIICVILIVDVTMGFLLANFFTFLGYPSSHMLILKVVLPIILIVIMIMSIYEAIYYNIRLKKSIREEEQTKQAMIQTQLDTLRNQAQPHFLFNSLNTLRDIIDHDPRENAKDFVDNLSSVYRFILESGNTNLIAIEKELKFAKAYVYVQSERFGDNLQINWNIPEDKLAAMIAPMSLQLLIENAIKHNIVSRDEPLTITITVKDDFLVVQNNIQVKSTKVHSTKIGLKNIEQRYALISSRLPKIMNDGNQFTVSLPLLKLSDQKKNYANTNY